VKHYYWLVGESRHLYLRARDSLWRGSEAIAATKPGRLGSLATSRSLTA
jgi:hypothetical protein